MIRSIILICAITITLLTDDAFAKETILWYWHTNGEVITFSVDIDQNVGTKEMNQFTRSLEIISHNSQYKNLEEFQNNVNRLLGVRDSINNFVIVDVTVDER